MPKTLKATSPRFLLNHTPVPEAINHRGARMETRLPPEPVVKPTRPEPPGKGEGRHSREIKAPLEARMGTRQAKPADVPPTGLMEQARTRGPGGWATAEAPEIGNFKDGLAFIPLKRNRLCVCHESEREAEPPGCFRFLQSIVETAAALGSCVFCIRFLFILED